MEPLNCVKELTFTGPHIGARFVSSVRDYYIGGRSVVVNPNRSDVVIDALRANVIPPFSSVILQDVYIATAASIIVLELVDLTNLGNIICEPGWALYGTLIADSPSQPDSAAALPFPANTPLWRSPQDEIGYVAFDPATLPGQNRGSHGDVRFLVKVDFWFAPANTNCFIHNQHPFIEIHSQITGYGRMQKFRAQDYSTLYHDEMMSPGYHTGAILRRCRSRPLCVSVAPVLRRRRLHLDGHRIPSRDLNPCRETLLEQHRQKANQ